MLTFCFPDIYRSEHDILLQTNDFIYIPIMHMWHEIYVHVALGIFCICNIYQLALMVFNQEQFFGFFCVLGKQYQSGVLKWVFVWWFISFTGIEIIHQLLNGLYALFLVIGY